MHIESVTAGSWSAETGPGRMRLARQVARGMMKEQDSDGSGSLTANETGLSAPAFAGMDGDADGQVTQREIINGLHDRNARLRQLLGDAGSKANPGQAHAARLAERALAGLDGNASASLGIDESGLSAEGFSRVDGNADGLLTAPEIANAIRDKRSEADAIVQRAAGATPSGNGGEAVIADTHGIADAQDAPKETATSTAVASAQHGDATPAPDAAQEPGASSPSRMRQGLSAYAGHMGELMTQLFGTQQMAETDMQESVESPSSATTMTISV